MNKRYPQEEERMYITESKYLLLRSRYGHAEDYNVSTDDFSRNIWLMEGDNIIWRIHTDIDEEGDPFRYLWLTSSEYLAVREDKNKKYKNNGWVLNIKTGHANRYIKEESQVVGGRQRLFIKRETRIYLDDGSYIILINIPYHDSSQNILRVSATGKEIWRISVNPEIDNDPDNSYGYLNLLRDGTIVATMDERRQFSIDVETGKATPGSFI